MDFLLRCFFGPLGCDLAGNFSSLGAFVAGSGLYDSAGSYGLARRQRVHCTALLRGLGGQADGLGWQLDFGLDGRHVWDSFFGFAGLAKRNYLGWGDVVLLGALAFLLGPCELLALIFYGLVPAGLVAAFCLFTDRAQRKDQWPLVPWLVLGFWLTLVLPFRPW